MPLRQLFALLSLTTSGLVIQAPLLVAQTPVSNNRDQLQQECIIHSPVDIFAGRYLYSPLLSLAPPDPNPEPPRQIPDNSSPAEAEMREAIDLNPTDINNYSQLTNFLEDADRLPEAISIYRQWIQNAPLSRLPYIRLGSVLLKQGEIDEAISTYRRGLQVQLGADEVHLFDILSPSRFHIAIGDLLQLQGKESEALESYIQGVEQNFAATTMGNGVLGNSRPDAREYQQMLDVQQAERIYRNLIQALPNVAFGYYRLTELLASQNRFDEAIALYRSWIPLAPDPPIINDLNFNIRPDQYLADLIQRKATHLREMGDFNGEVATYRTLIEIQPEDSFNRVYLAKVLVEKGDLETAADEYRQLTSENPSRGVFHVVLGTILHCQGDTNGAFLAYTQAASLRESELPGYHFLGNLEVKQGRLEEAARAYRRVLEIHHLSELGLLSPGEFQQYDELFQQRRWQEAISFYQELVESTHSNSISPPSFP
jgi:tetratricopeptide (TPR) repeat protein